MALPLNVVDFERERRQIPTLFLMNVSCGRIENINDKRRGCCRTMMIERERERERVYC